MHLQRLSAHIPWLPPCRITSLAANIFTNNIGKQVCSFEHPRTLRLPDLKSKSMSYCKYRTLTTALSKTTQALRWTGLRLDTKCHYTGQADNHTSISPSNSPSFKAFLEHLLREHQAISGQLVAEVNPKKQRGLVKRLAELSPVVDVVGRWAEKRAELEEIEELIEGPSLTTQDIEMREMAEQEKQGCAKDIEILENEIFELLIPSDGTDNNDVIVELSAGVGGQEAMLFTADMFQMYEHFAAYMGWRLQRMAYFTTDLGGLRHAVLSVSGKEAYKLLKKEAGVHRVQRVPKTEKSGRIHTSTMAVVVLPQPKEIDLKLDPKDLRIETKKASGAGGQHVNTTDSAVRIVHLPTGTAAESQQERSQIKNRAIAMTMLHTRIYSALLERRTAEEDSLRRGQVSSAARSEKIRTYNFQQDRVTDHRIGRSAFDVEGFLTGGERLEEMIRSLVEEDGRGAVKRMVEEFVMREGGH